MGESDEVQKLIDEINFRKTNSKNYEKMNAVEISKEFKEIMEFEKNHLKKLKCLKKHKRIQI